MHFLVDTWRSIGARLYLALGFAVLLTLASSAVGVYYFEQSGDLNFRVRSESVPVLEASWAAANETERLRAIGLGMLGEGDTGPEEPQAGSVTETLKRLEGALTTVSGAAALESNANAVNDAAYDLAQVIDEIEVQRAALAETDAAAGPAVVEAGHTHGRQWPVRQAPVSACKGIAGQRRGSPRKPVA